MQLNFFCEIATYTSKLLSFDGKLEFNNNKKRLKNELFLLIALYGARVRGSVFRMKFRVSF